MSAFAILYLVGIFLLGLGALSGVVLFFRAAAGTAKSAEASTGTLWGLFIVCMIAGLILMLASFGRS